MILSDALNNGTLGRHYSDAGVKIRQVETDFVYDEAIDVVPCKYAYVETDEPIDPKPTLEE